jgi:exodeoxyribonuclease V alpha subunit
MCILSDDTTLALKRQSGVVLKGREDEQFLQGTVRRVTYRSPQTGFGVLRVESESTNEDVIVVGDVSPTIGSGSLIIARGYYHRHARFGEQFKAFSITETEPTTEEGLSRYLSTIKGFGEVLAERAIAAFGEDIVRILDEAPHRLIEVPGIGKKKLEEISSAWQESRQGRELQLFFSEYGISGTLGAKIRRRYGNKAIEKIKENPYLLADDISGVGFAKADKIALALGIAPLSDLRLGAALEHILKSSSDEGNTCLPEDILLSRTAKQLECEDDSLLQRALTRIISEGRVVKDSVDGRALLYNPEIHLAEVSLARQLKRLFNSSVEALSDEIIDRVAGEKHLATTMDTRLITLSAEQQLALRVAARKPLCIVTGGPGCGKTTLVRAMVSMFRASGALIRLASPTGRAAQRLSEVCSHEASTIHRLLRFDPFERDFVHRPGNPIECDVLIVDEVSMLDVPLANSLFSALPEGCRVVLIGDSDQLPSVGPGLFLAEMIEIAASNTIRLTNLFRRSTESLISVAAFSVNSGEIPEIPEPDGGITKSDAYFLNVSDATEGAEMIERLVTTQIPKKFGFTREEITVLSPMNQGELGTININRRLQERLTSNSTASLANGSVQFRLGDRVCQRVNNYQIHPAGVFNGDQGEVIGVDTENGQLIVRLWDGREIEYPRDGLGQLDLAYALSIHRSQGSEIPAVVLALHTTHAIMLERQLLYTAITRAKKLLIIVGNRRSLEMAVKRTRSKRRYTSLLSRF